MIKVATAAQVRSQLQEWRTEKQSIALVPTMGNLHAGHLDLIQRALAVAERVVITIFVNPMQFSANEDYHNYPRTLEVDCEKLLQVGTDLLFIPQMTDIYPLGIDNTTRVEVPKLSAILCGAFRPGHFVGVTTIVNKLFNIVQPDKALFGEKDYQQLLLIKRMVADLAMPIEIIGIPTVREADGLAMSSRNSYLTSEQRAIAPKLFQILTTVKNQIESGQSAFVAVEQRALHELQRAGFTPEYVAVRQASTLEIPSLTEESLVVLAAARLGVARLIDNVVIDRGRNLPSSLSQSA